MHKMKLIEARVVKNLWSIKLRVQKIDEHIQKNSSDTRASSEAITRAKNYASNFKEVLDFFDARSYTPKKERFLSDIKTCFTKVKEFRLNSLCAQCSGRAQIFLEGTKLRMSADACTDIVKECVGQWDFMYQFMQSMKTINFLTKVKKTFGKKEGKLFEPKKEEGPETSADSKSIIEDLNALANVEKDSIVFNDDVQNLCTKLLVFDGYNDDLSGDDKIVDEVVKVEDEAQAEVKRMPLAEKAKRDAAIRVLMANKTK